MIQKELNQQLHLQQSNLLLPQPPHVQTLLNNIIHMMFHSIHLMRLFQILELWEVMFHLLILRELRGLLQPLLVVLGMKARKRKGVCLG